MDKTSVSIGGRCCRLFVCGSPRFLLIQPCGPEDDAGMALEAEEIAERTGVPFALAFVRVRDWNSELSPWKAPAVFGSEDFGCGAAELLKETKEQLIPALCDMIKAPATCAGTGIPVILGGYSLAGLFSLWAAYASDRFSAVWAASPSVWFPGWVRFASERKPFAEHIYLSLGKKEEKTKNRVMSTVGDCIRLQHQILGPELSILEWNEGNHFRDPHIRCAKGAAWCIRACEP